MTHEVTEDGVILRLSVEEFTEISKALLIVGNAHLELGTEPPALRKVVKGMTDASVSVVMKKLETLFQE